MQSEITARYGRRLTPAEAWSERQSLWAREQYLTQDTGIPQRRWEEEARKSHQSIKFTPAVQKAGGRG